MIVAVVVMIVSFYLRAISAAFAVGRVYRMWYAVRRCPKEIQVFRIVNGREQTNPNAVNGLIPAA